MKINARAIDSVSFVFAKWLIFSVDLLSKDAAPKGRRIFSGPYLHWHAGGRCAVGGRPQLPADHLRANVNMAPKKSAAPSWS